VKRAWLVGGGIVLALFVLLAVVTVLLPESTAHRDGSLTNARPNGSRALGQVLDHNGVSTSQVTTLAEAAAAATGSTLAVYLDRPLSDAAAAQLSRAAADLVVIVAGNDGSSVRTLSEQRISGTSWWIDSSTLPEAACTDPDAAAAGTMTPSSTGVEAYNSTQVTICFGDFDGAGLYADTTTPRHRVTVIAGSDWLRNDTITDGGNAALGLRVLGRHPQVVWYLPGADAEPTFAGPDAGRDLFALLPGWGAPRRARHRRCLAGRH